MYFHCACMTKFYTHTHLSNSKSVNSVQMKFTIFRRHFNVCCVCVCCVFYVFSSLYWNVNSKKKNIQNLFKVNCSDKSVEHPNYLVWIKKNSNRINWSNVHIWKLNFFSCKSAWAINKIIIEIDRSYWRIQIQHIPTENHIIIQSNVCASFT